MWLQHSVDVIDTIAEAKIIGETSIPKDMLANEKLSTLNDSEERKHYKMSVILEHLDMKPTPYTKEFFELTETNFTHLQLVAGKLDEAFVMELTRICPHVLFWLSDRHRQARSAAEWQAVGPELGL